MVSCCAGGALKGAGSASKSNWVLVCCLLCFIVATSYLATSHKSYLFDLWLNNARLFSRKEEWPSAQFWGRLSRSARANADQCPLSGCSISASSRQNRSTHFTFPFSAGNTCPFHFKYIHEDLQIWAKSGVTKQMLEKQQSVASFRVVIKNGRLYVDAYEPCFQTRGVFTVWGLLQLLDYYPGLVPDVDLLFGCGDTPRVPKKNYANRTPPPVFRYCSTVKDFDIPFPDWSFWGWPEVDLKTWDEEMYGILKGQNDVLWERRRPLAFWKGNTDTGGALRKELQKCNGALYKADIIHQNWWEATKAGFKNSRLAQQCKHRYKVYVEGWGWSVSLKYILACDSPALVVNPLFYDYFSRGLMPMEHYWPIRPSTLCKSIKFAVEWGNNHTYEAESLGRMGSQFVVNNLSMKHVYDYMLQALHEYAKLLRFEPNAGGFTELCSEAFLCQAPPNERPLYEASRVRQASATPPCFLPPREEGLIQERWQRRLNITNLVQEVEDGSNDPTLIAPSWSWR